MSDRFIPIRQYVPPVQPRTPNVAAHMMSNSQISNYGENSQPGNLSFQATLNRQQMTEAQLKSMQSPTGQSQSMAPTRAKAMPAMPSTPNVQTLAQSNDVPPEVREMMRNAPARVPQGEDLYKTMMRNAQQYQEMKTQKTDPQSSQWPTDPFSQLNPTPKTNVRYELSEIPAIGGFDLKEVERQAINADLMQQPSVSSQGYAQSYHSTLSDGAIASNASNLQRPIGSTLAKPSIESQTVMGQAAYKRADMMKKDAAANENQAANPHPNQSSNELGPTEIFFSFFKNVASGVTLGFYQPDGQDPPDGAMRVIDPFKKLVWDAPKSILYDTPASMVRSIGDEEKSGSNQSNKTDQMISHEPAPRESSSFSGRSSSKPWLHRHG